MKIILRSDVQDLGSAGDLVNVKHGYARNYLFPRSLAVEADKGSVRAMEHERRQIALREKKKLGELEQLAHKIRGVSVTVTKEVGENDRLFGSVTSMDIHRALEAEGVKIDRRTIDLEEPIKAIGVYDVPVKLHRTLDVKLKVWVVKA